MASDRSDTGGSYWPCTSMWCTNRSGARRCRIHRSDNNASSLPPIIGAEAVMEAANGDTNRWILRVQPGTTNADVQKLCSGAPGNKICSWLATVMGQWGT